MLVTCMPHNDSNIGIALVIVLFIVIVVGLEILRVIVTVLAIRFVMVSPAVLPRAANAAFPV